MVTTINTLIVDDDPHARNILSRVVQMNPLLTLVGASASALEAYAKRGMVVSESPQKGFVFG